MPRMEEFNKWLNVIGGFLLGASLTSIYGLWKGVSLAIAIVIIKWEIISRIQFCYEKFH